ncbi:hypothetical protein PPYR_04050 [Photinus pyralis]|uniref:Thiolase N-terminal domain-containing protein n=1 Tax=Photinus pyralis TaxID=7054 RepID=A0A5N4AWZ9_PHOPY|nr:hypothetical protein PPYR_04050 [Photinus pyralis]
MMENDGIYIIAACRTGIGALNGQFKNTPGTILGATVIKCCLEKAQILPSDISEVIIGQVLTAGQGQNPARQAAIQAGIPWSTPAFTVNMLGGSSLKAVYLGYQAIRCKTDVKVVMCGGQENMTMAQHSVNVRNMCEPQEIQVQDTILMDGLLDPLTGLHISEVAERFAAVNQITREVQDRFALRSHNRAERSVVSKVFEQEIVAVQQSEGKSSVIKDELVQKNVTLPQLCEMPPVITADMLESSGTVTKGNSAVAADAAAAVILCSGEQIERRNFIPLVRLVEFAEIGTNPFELGVAVVIAIEEVLTRSSWSKEDVDLFEVDETFSSQVVFVVKKLEISMKKVNVASGSIALGRPLGANGARMLVTLVNNLHRLRLQRGVVVASISGGMAIAVSVQRR